MCGWRVVKKSSGNKSQAQKKVGKCRPFLWALNIYQKERAALLADAIGDATLTQIVRRHFDLDLIAR